MNKKLIYTGIWLCLGGLSLGEAVWAKSEKAASPQSVKFCPKEYVEDPSALVLTKKMPNTRFDDNGTPDPTDDSFERCNKDFSVCEFVVEGAVPRQIIIGSNGTNIIEGTPGNDIICGNNGNDIIDGREGNDEIHGNNGNDRLFGDLGNDSIYGGNGNDFLSGYLDDNFAYDQDPGNNDDAFNDDDVLNSDEDHLYGGNGKDQLLGGPDIDNLHGENGKDDLDGGDSDDIISGGKGKDNCLDDDNVGGNDCSETELEDEHGPGHN
ncbi:MAG: calcium-binding protein [Methylomicrobium sp.]